MPSSQPGQKVLTQEEGGGRAQVEGGACGDSAGQCPGAAWRLGAFLSLGWLHGGHGPLRPARTVTLLSLVIGDRARVMTLG